MNAYRVYNVIEKHKWAEQMLTERKRRWVDDRAQEIIDMLLKGSSGLFRFSMPMDESPYEDLCSDSAGEVYNDLISVAAYAQMEYDRNHRTGCPF